MKLRLTGLALVLLCSAAMIRPLAERGYFPMHDDTQVARVIAMGDALQNGQFPVRWVNGLGYGYGYPIFNFYGPLPYYAGGMLSAVGADPVTATKTMMAAGMVLAGIFMFILASSVTGTAGGVVAAALYMYAPYHAVQLYVRGAVGELWAYAFFPLLLVALLEAWKPASRPAATVLAGAAGLTGIILSHTVFGYVTVAVLAAYMAVMTVGAFGNPRLRRPLGRTVLMAVEALGLTAFFWLPAFAEKRYTSVQGSLWDPVRYREHFVCLGQLWNSAWGFGGSASGCTDGMSFMLGKLHILLFAAAAGLVTGLRGNNRRIWAVFGVSAGLALISIFLMLPVSLPVWQIFPYAEYIQYPWRLLSYAALGLSLGGALWITFIGKRAVRAVAATAAVAGILLYNAKWFRPQFTYAKTAAAFESAEDMRWRASKISDEYLPPDFKRPSGLRGIAALPVDPTPWRTVQYVKDTETDITVGITTDHAEAVQVNRAAFPGWTYRVDGVTTQPFISNGIPAVQVPKGHSTLEISFRNTPVRTLADILSIIAGTVMILYYGKKNYR